MGGNVTKPITKETNEEKMGTNSNSHVTANANEGKVWKSPQHKITNVRLRDYQW